MSEEFLQQMAGNTPINAVPADGSLTTPKYGLDSITPGATNFIKKGKNIFSGNFAWGTSFGGVVIGADVPISSTPGAVSVIEKINPNTNYTISYKVGSSNDRFRIAVSSVYPSVGTLVKILSIPEYGAVRQTINSGAGANYLIIYLDNSNSTPPIEFQIEEGVTRTTYESPHKIKAEFVDRSIENRAIKPFFGTLNGRSTGFNVSFSEGKIITNSTAMVTAGDNRISLADAEYSLAGLSSVANAVMVNMSNGRLVIVPTALSHNKEYSDYMLIGHIHTALKEAYFNGFYQTDGRSSSRDKPFIADRALGRFKADVPEFTHTYSINAVYKI